MPNMGTMVITNDFHGNSGHVCDVIIHYLAGKLLAETMADICFFQRNAAKCAKCLL